MRFREAANGRRGLRFAALCLAGVWPLLFAACGEDDFKNDPRPASPIEVTAAIDDENVSISPSRLFCPNPEDKPSCLGAGLVNVTVSNQTDDVVRLVFEGPTTATSEEIVAGGTASIKTTLDEGEYEVAAGAEVGVEPAELEVGPPRPTSQNELLQP